MIVCPPLQPPFIYWAFICSHVLAFVSLGSLWACLLIRGASLVRLIRVKCEVESLANKIYCQSVCCECLSSPLVLLGKCFFKLSVTFICCPFPCLQFTGYGFLCVDIDMLSFLFPLQTSLRHNLCLPEGQLPSTIPTQRKSFDIYILCVQANACIFDPAKCAYCKSILFRTAVFVNFVLPSDVQDMVLAMWTVLCLLLLISQGCSSFCAKECSQCRPFIF